ncbi:MAG: hypothetical protein M3Y35_18045, partial [Actinomycetota bacterium]|nr:hypothetical protein [Actinomycetota bacterium]
MTLAPSTQQTSQLDRGMVRNFLSGEMPASAVPEPKWGPIGREVYERTYSRDIAADGVERKETWAETVRRVVLGNTGFAPPESLLIDEAVELFELIHGFKMLPAGRHLWVTGTTSPFSRNCWVAGFSPRTSDHFAYLASRLFEGGGVGSNYSADLIARTQPVAGDVAVRITCEPEHQDFVAVREAAGNLWVDRSSVSDRE